MHAVLDHIENITDTIRTYWLRPEGPVRYIAGQFVEISLEHEKPDSRGIRRWFTLSSSPTEPLLGITTKFSRSDGSTFKQSLLGLAPGARLLLSEPMGDFVLPKDSSVPLVFVAAGMGVTPIRSITKWLADTGEERDTQLLYTARDKSELAFGDFFQSFYGDNFKSFTSRPLNATEVIKAAQIKPRCLIYLAGQETKISQLEKSLLAAGLPKDRLVTDFFHGYANI